MQFLYRESPSPICELSESLADVNDPRQHHMFETNQSFKYYAKKRPDFKMDG